MILGFMILNPVEFSPSSNSLRVRVFFVVTGARVSKLRWFVAERSMIDKEELMCQEKLLGVIPQFLCLNQYLALRLS